VQDFFHPQYWQSRRSRDHLELQLPLAPASQLGLVGLLWKLLGGTFSWLFHRRWWRWRGHILRTAIVQEGNHSPSDSKGQSDEPFAVQDPQEPNINLQFSPANALLNSRLFFHLPKWAGPQPAALQTIDGPWKKHVWWMPIPPTLEIPHCSIFQFSFEFFKRSPISSNFDWRKQIENHRNTKNVALKQTKRISLTIVHHTSFLDIAPRKQTERILLRSYYITISNDSGMVKPYIPCDHLRSQVPRFNHDRSILKTLDIPKVGNTKKVGNLETWSSEIWYIYIDIW